MGIPGHVIGLEPDVSQKSFDPIMPFPGFGQVVNPQRLSDDLPDAQPGIERRVGILEDHLHLGPEMDHLGPIHIRNILAFEEDGEASLSIFWFDGNFSDYEADRKRRLGIAADTPHRIKYKPLKRV